MLKSIIDRVIPAVTGFVTGGPTGTAVALMATEKQKRAERNVKRQNEIFLQEYNEMMDFYDPYKQQIIPNNPNIGNNNNGGFWSTVRGGIQDVGNVVRDVFDTGLPQIFGYNQPTPSNRNQPAITTVTNVGAKETAGSGSVEAGVNLIPSVINAGKSFLRSGWGQAIIGGGAAAGLSLIGADGRPIRVTRKMKSQARMVLNMTGGNLQAAAQILGVDEQALVSVLLKRFRNDGPVVTKAALRKTKQTVRRLKNMCDMYESLRPSASRRRTPVKRASTTLISNK